MAVIGNTRRPLLLVAAFVLLHATLGRGAVGPARQALPARGPQSEPRAVTMAIPGGTERLLRAAGIPVPVEPARVLLAVIRKAHNLKPASPVRLPPAVYLDGVSRIAAAARQLESGRSDSVVAFFDACGFAVDRGNVWAPTAADVARRRNLLEQAGFPVKEWATWLGANQRAPAEVEKFGRDIVSSMTETGELAALLPPAVWSSAVFEREVSAMTLAAAILADRRASLFYYGLFALDDETLGYFSRTPALVAALARSAGEFAAFSDGIAIRDGRVVLPGGPSAAAFWDALTGASSADPGQFLPALFSRQEGRLAWLFNTVAHLDAPHQAFALGVAMKDSSSRMENLRQLLDVFVAFERGGPRIADRPFTRSTPDPQFILEQLRVTEDGRMAVPRDGAFWDAVFGTSGSGRTTDPTSDEGVNAAWIVGQIASRPISTRRQVLDAVLFAQRLAAASQVANQPAAADAMMDAVSAFASRSALMVTLERLGLLDPAEYALAARTTEALTRGDARRASLALAQFQGALTLLVRLHDVGAVGDGAAADLAHALISSAGVDWAVAAWLDRRLLPALPKTATDTPQAVEDRLIDTLAGVSTAHQRPVVQWEDRTYRVDVAAGERARLRRIREKQADVDLGDVIDFFRAASRLVEARTAADLTQAAEQVRRALPKSDLLDGEATLFGKPVPRLREPVTAAVGAVVAKPSDATRADVAQRLNEATDVLLADALASLTYALAIGDPDAASLLAGNPARRHEFALDMPSSVGWWRIPEEARSAERLVLRGSLLGLDRTLGRDWLRPITLDVPDIGRRMTPEDLRGFGEAVAALSGFRLADADRDAIAAAIMRGRERIRDAHGPAGLDSIAQQAGVDGQRRRLIGEAAAHDLSATPQYFSLDEMLRLGTQASPTRRLPGWGLPSRALDGSLGLQLPHGLSWPQMAGRTGAVLMSAHVFDLQLHVIETLSELRLPSALVPGVLSFATWDVTMSAAMTDSDDWLAIIRAAQALPRDRIADYVSALTADGALVPVEVK